MSDDPVGQALTALQRQDYPATRAAMARHAATQPFDFRACQIQGLAELAMEDWGAARLTFSAAARQFPAQALGWLNLGTACENLNLLTEAVTAFEQALRLHPGLTAACGNLANLYRRQGRFKAAETMARRALSLDADRPQALNCLALALGRQGQFTGADIVIREALASAPRDPVLLANAANLAVDQLHFDRAWPCFSLARALDDRAVFRRDEGMARLLAGDATGWPLYEARLDLPGALRTTPQLPRWRGEDLNGKTLLLVAEQGYGDVIQFCRYGSGLAARGAKLIWLVPQLLQPLLAANLPGIVQSETDPVATADYWVPLMSLPLLAGAGVAGRPYLTAPQSLPALARRTIGLVWAGSNTHERDHERSIPLARLAPLWRQTGIDFIAPFAGRGLEEITPEIPVRLPEQPLHDFAATAALLQQLHLLATVDTAAAHLAGALGVRTLLLLPHCPDWRWEAQGETTPWYDSITVLRQPRYGDWDSVIATAAERLAA